MAGLDPAILYNLAQSTTSRRLFERRLPMPITINLPEVWRARAYQRKLCRYLQRRRQARHRRRPPPLGQGRGGAALGGLRAPCRSRPPTGTCCRNTPRPAGRSGTPSIRTPARRRIDEAFPAGHPRAHPRGRHAHPLPQRRRLAGGGQRQLRPPRRHAAGRHRVLRMGARRSRRLGLFRPHPRRKRRLGAVPHHPARAQPCRGDVRHGRGEPRLVRRAPDHRATPAC